jgi:LmbE family N-acetylglucosaminyl deacetylase
MAAPTQIALAIGAHPDDIEFQCAGTLALLRQRGWRVALATMTPGDLGSATLGRDETARIRREEARRSAALLEADYFCLEGADFTVFFGDGPCRRVTGLIRTVQPDLVLTHSPVDYLPDHEETSRIVRQACFAAPVPQYDARGVPGAAGPTARVPHLYYFDPVEAQDYLGRPVEAWLVVDISAVVDTKEQMLAQHASQREWLRRQHGCDDYLDEMRKWSRARGCLAGCAFGEGFRQHLGHAYPRDDLLAAALGPVARVLARRA